MAGKVQQVLLVHLLTGLDSPEASPEAALAMARSIAPLLFDEGEQGSFLRSQRKAYLRALWLLQVMTTLPVVCHALSAPC